MRKILVIVTGKYVEHISVPVQLELSVKVFAITITLFFSLKFGNIS